MSAPLEIAFEKRISEEIKKLGPLRFCPEDRARVGDVIEAVIREIYGAELALVMAGTQAQKDAAADFTIRARQLEKQGYTVEAHMVGGGLIGVASIPWSQEDKAARVMRGAVLST